MNSAKDGLNMYTHTYTCMHACTHTLWSKDLDNFPFQIFFSNFFFQKFFFSKIFFQNFFFQNFCLDEISFRRDYKSCRIGVVRSLFVVQCATFMETLRWDNFCNFGATLLGFGTLFTNIILLWIRNFEKKSDHPNPPKNSKKPQKRLMDFHNGIYC